MIAHLVDRIDGYKCFGIGLTDEIHQLSVLVLIHDRNNLFSGGVFICTDNFVKGCSAMKVVEDKTYDLIRLRRDHTYSSLDVQGKDEMINDHSAEIRTEHTQYDNLRIIAKGRR